jgi:DNA-binding NarL/FixJ family response regulator
MSSAEPAPVRGPAATIRVLVVDDHPVVRRGLTDLLASVPDIEVVGSAGDGDAGVTLVGTLDPDVVLMDIEMPTVDGVEATQRIGATAPRTAVVILTTFADRARITRALDAGAAGYLLKDAEPSELIDGIRAAAAGSTPISPRAASRLAEQPDGPIPESLTPREREVLTLLADGLANKQIARRLGIAETTVKAHLTRVFAALDVSDRTQAALWVERNAREH